MIDAHGSIHLNTAALVIDGLQARHDDGRTSIRLTTGPLAVWVSGTGAELIEFAAELLRLARSVRTQEREPVTSTDELTHQDPADLEEVPS